MTLSTRSDPPLPHRQGKSRAQGPDIVAGCSGSQHPDPTILCESSANLVCFRSVFKVTIMVAVVVIIIGIGIGIVDLIIIFFTVRHCTSYRTVLTCCRTYAGLPFCFSSSAERMKIPAWQTGTSEQKGLSPQSHADGLLRDTISGRAKSAQAGKKKVEKPVVDQPVLTGKTRKRRTQSARAAYRDVWQDSLTASREAAAAPELMSPMVTQELLRNWGEVLR